MLDPMSARLRSLISFVSISHAFCLACIRVYSSMLNVARHNFPNSPGGTVDCLLRVYHVIQNQNKSQPMNVNDRRNVYEYRRLTLHPTIGRPTLTLLSCSVVAVPLDAGVGVAGRLISACKAMFSLTATYSLSAYPSSAEIWLLLRPLMRFTSLVE